MNLLFKCEGTNVKKHCLLLMLFCCYNFKTFARDHPKYSLQLMKAENFKDAQHKCKKSDGKLVTPFDKEKVDAIVSTITANKGMEIDIINILLPQKRLS